MDSEQAKDIYSEGLMVGQRITNSPLVDELKRMIEFIAMAENINFVRPTEFRPTWRLIQTDGEAARTLGEGATPYECVRQAMEVLNK